MAPLDVLPANELVGLLRDSARSKSTHARGQRKAQELLAAGPLFERETDGGFFEHLRRVLVVKKRDGGVDRVIAFIAQLAANSLAKSKEDAAASEEEPTTERVFVSKLLCELSAATGAADGVVRQRACELVARCLDAILLADDEAEFEEEDWATLVHALVPRLQDKVAAVRAHACSALARLQENDTASSASAALLEAMQFDRCAEVRRAAVYAIEPSRRTLVPLYTRTRDVDAGVRAAAFDVLRKKVPFTCKLVTRARTVALMRRGLADREPRARVAALALLLRWFAASSIKSSPAKLVVALEGAGAEQACLLALRALHAAAVALQGDTRNRDFEAHAAKAKARGWRARKISDDGLDFDADVLFFDAEEDEDGAKKGAFTSAEALRILEAALAQADTDELAKDRASMGPGGLTSPKKRGGGAKLDSRAALLAAMLPGAEPEAFFAVEPDAAQLSAAQAISLRSRLDCELRPTAPALTAGALQDALAAYSTAPKLAALLETASAMQVEVSADCEDEETLALAEDREFVAGQLLRLARVVMDAHVMDISSARQIAETIAVHFAAHASPTALRASLAGVVADALFAANDDVAAHMQTLADAKAVCERRALALAAQLLGNALDASSDAARLEVFARAVEDDFFLPALISPDGEARAAAVVGLGRRCHTSVADAARLAPVLRRVAQKDTQEKVRGRAVQAFCDVAQLQGAATCEGVAETLVALIRDESRALGAVAAEGAARLLLSGRAAPDDEAPLLAELLVFYFSDAQQEDEEEDDDDEEDDGEDLALGSRVRLQQVLAVFFAGYFSSQANDAVVGAVARSLLAAPAGGDAGDAAERAGRALRYVVELAASAGVKASSLTFVVEYEMCFSVLEHAAAGGDHLAAAAALCKALSTLGLPVDAPPAHAATLSAVARRAAAAVDASRLPAAAARHMRAFAAKVHSPADADSALDPRGILAGDDDDDADDARPARKNEAPSRGARSARKAVSYCEKDEDDVPTRPRAAAADEAACGICGRVDDSATVLLCDGCDGEFHMACLDPPLSAIPEGDWFCPECAAAAADVQDQQDE